MNGFGNLKCFGLISVTLAVLIIIICGLYFGLDQGESSQIGASRQNPSKPLDITEFRLPESIKPKHQYVKLQPFLHDNYTIIGFTEITLEVLESTNHIYLHMVDLITINETIKLWNEVNSDILLDFTSHSYDLGTNFYIGETVDQLNPGTYHLSMEFTGYLNDNLVGFYRSSYTDENSNTVPIAVSQFAAIDARRAFPCFDEPSMKSTFKIEIAREQNVHTLSNMPLENTTAIVDQPGWFLDTFEVSLPMSTYLVAFVVSDFAATNSSANDHVLFRVWAQEAALEETEYALKIGPQVLTFYEQYYEIPFPLPKQDMVAIPDFYYGAMENWGLITYRGSRLLYNPVVSSADSKQTVCKIIAHELAHQWFGNLVTNKWWNDIWLNEGFATFVQCIGCDQVEPTFGMLDQFFIQHFHVSLAVDSLESSHPLDFPINTPEDIGGIYDTISYSKGGSVLHMIENFITEASFRAGLVSYLKEFSYQNAEREDLWDHLTTQSHLDGTLPPELTINELMDPWALQTGYPVLTVQRNPNGTVLLTQEKFLLVQQNDTSNITWWIPITYTTESEGDFNDTRATLWINPLEKTKSLDGLSASARWIIFNVQENGYYRVNYDEDNWRALIGQLVEDCTKIHRINRAQMFNDAYNLARAGRLDYEIPLGINSYLNQETEYVPLYAGLNELSYLRDMFQQQDGYTYLKEYLLELLIPLYEEVGFEDNLLDPHLTQLKRTLLSSWVCHLGYLPCMSSSTTLYSDWMETPSNHTIISPNLKETVYCTAVAVGGVAEWQFAFNQYQTTRFAVEEDNLLEAMGCTNDQNLLLNYLTATFVDGTIKKQDASKVIGATSQNPNGEDLTWDYLFANATDIATYMGSFRDVANYVNVASKNFNTQSELQKLEDFKSKYSDELGTSVNTIDSAIERTQNNINWMTNYYSDILTWLQSNR